MAIKLILDKALEQRNVSRYRLSKLTETDYQIIDNYYKNKVVRYDSYILNKICNCLDCDISDIIAFEKDDF